MYAAPQSDHGKQIYSPRTLSMYNIIYRTYIYIFTFKSVCIYIFDGWFTVQGGSNSCCIYIYVFAGLAPQAFLLSIRSCQVGKTGVVSMAFTRAGI